MEVLHETPTFPFSEVHTATDGPTSAQSTYDFAMSEDSAFLESVFDHTRSASDSWAEAFGSITFIPTEAVDYSLEGSFGLSGAGRIRLFASLVDLSVYPDPGILYRGDHESDATPDEHFTLGMPGGDLVSQEEGGLSGSLTPGTLYQMSYAYSIRNDPFDPESAATAAGGLNFVLIPEPGSFGLVMLAGVMLMRRRR